MPAPARPAPAVVVRHWFRALLLADAGALAALSLPGSTANLTLQAPPARAAIGRLLAELARAEVVVEPRGRGRTAASVRFGGVRHRCELIDTTSGPQVDPATVVHGTSRHPFVLPRRGAGRELQAS